MTKTTRQIPHYKTTKQRKQDKDNKTNTTRERQQDKDNMTKTTRQRQHDKYINI